LDEISVNPGRCRVFGNIIGNRYGYLESSEGFQSHKAEVSLNAVENEAYEDFNVYSFTLTKNENLVNGFNDDVAYCKSVTPSSNNSWLYVCEHFNTAFDPIESIANIETFNNGYKIVLKDEYIDNNRDNTAPFYLMIHQSNTGVVIPSGTNRITFSTSFKASPTIDSIQVGFVFFNSSKQYIGYEPGADIASPGTGNRGRCNVQTTNIPSNAKYVSVEFNFPNGVGRYTNVDGELLNDYFSMELNCILFNQTYGGFVKNG
jgi:hypothetical protein